jgi:hypothetical protein
MSEPHCAPCLIALLCVIIVIVVGVILIIVDCHHGNYRSTCAKFTRELLSAV